MIGSRPICWSSKKPVALSISSAKEEYRGDVNATIQSFWLHGISTEFGIHISPTVDLYCDNQITIKISSDPVQKQRKKLIEVHMRYIRELVHDRTITLHYCPTEDQIADIFTKSFTKKRFSFLKSLLGIKALFSVPTLRRVFRRYFPTSFVLCLLDCILGDLWSSY